MWNYVSEIWRIGIVEEWQFPKSHERLHMRTQTLTLTCIHTQIHTHLHSLTCLHYQSFGRPFRVCLCWKTFCLYICLRCVHSVFHSIDWNESHSSLVDNIFGQIMIECTNHFCSMLTLIFTERHTITEEKSSPNNDVELGVWTVSESVHFHWFYFTKGK